MTALPVVGSTEKFPANESGLMSVEPLVDADAAIIKDAMPVVLASFVAGGLAGAVVLGVPTSSSKVTFLVPELDLAACA